MKYYRKKLGLSQTEFAKWFGRSRPWLAHRENGRFAPTSTELLRAKNMVENSWTIEESPQDASKFVVYKRGQMAYRLHGKEMDYRTAKKVVRRLNENEKVEGLKIWK